MSLLSLLVTDLSLGALAGEPASLTRRLYPVGQPTSLASWFKIQPLLYLLLVQAGLRCSDAVSMSAGSDVVNIRGRHAKKALVSQESLWISASCRRVFAN